MELTEEAKELLIKTAKSLKGSAHRLFLARTVRALGEGGQRLAERELGGIVGRSAKANMNENMGLSVLMRSRRGAASAVKSIYLTCFAISLPSWTGRVKLTRSFAPPA